MTANTDLLRETLTLAEKQLRHAGDLLSRYTTHVRSGIDCAEMANKCRDVLDPPCRPHDAWVMWRDKAPPTGVPIYVRHDSRQDDPIGSPLSCAADLPYWANIAGLWWRRA